MAAGTKDCYPDWTPFTCDEIRQGIGLLTRNGLSPVPEISLLFVDPQSSFVWGDDRVRKMWPRGKNRWQEFRAFFHIAPHNIHCELEGKSAAEIEQYVNAPLRKLEFEGGEAGRQ